MKNCNVKLDKYLLTSENNNYFHQFQFSEVSKECLLFLFDIAYFNVTYTRLQTDGTYIVQAESYSLSKEMLEVILKSAT